MHALVRIWAGPELTKYRSQEGANGEGWRMNRREEVMLGISGERREGLGLENPDRLRKKRLGRTVSEQAGKTSLTIAIYT